MNHSAVARRASWVGLLALTTLLAACGGSVVKPADFVGALPATGAAAGPGVVDGGTSPVTGTGTGTSSGTGTSTGTGTGTGTGATGAGTGSGTGSGTNAGTGSGTGSGAASGSGSGSAGASGALAGVKVGSCAGFKNGPGITSKEIDLATIADRSGAVADTFKSAHDAMNAYVAYFNATVPNGICGRRLTLQTYDSALTASGSNQASKSACTSAFALVGSFSAFDSGGADVTAKCGQPDIRAAAAERARQDAPTTFQIMPIDTNHFGIEPWALIKQKFGNVVKKAAFVYLNAGASGVVTDAIRKQTAKSLGYDWQKTIVVDIAGVPNWNAYANQLKSAGIQFVSTNLADFTPHLAAAFKQAGFSPVFLADNSAYGQRYVTGSDGQAMDGVYVYTQTAMMEEAGKVPEMATYATWLGRTGGDPPSYSGAESWAAGALFAKLAAQLGGKLTRSSLISALRGVHDFNGNGIITPTDPGRGSSGRCATLMQVRSGKFVRITPYPYSCGPLG